MVDLHPPEQGSLRRRSQCCAGAPPIGEVLELAFGHRQAAADLTQRVSLADLKEHHSHELSPAEQPAQVAAGVMPAHGLLTFQARKIVTEAGKRCYKKRYVVEPSCFDRHCFLESYPTCQRLNPLTRNLIWTRVLLSETHLRSTQTAKNWCRV